MMMAAAAAAFAAPVGPRTAAATADAHVVQVVDVKIVSVLVRVANQHVFLLGRVGSICVVGLDDFLPQVGVPARVAARQPDQRLEVLFAGDVDIDGFDGASGPAGGGGGRGG